MKVVYEPGEIEQIEARHKEFIDTGLGMLFAESNPDRIYGITFKVTNPALATYILGGLLNDRLPEFEMGIDVQSINFDTRFMSTSDLREKLHAMIDEIV